MFQAKDNFIGSLSHYFVYLFIFHKFISFDVNDSRCRSLGFQLRKDAQRDCCASGRKETVQQHAVFCSYNYRSIASAFS